MVPEIIAERAQAVRDDFRRANIGREYSRHTVRRMIVRLAQRVA